MTNPFYTKTGSPAANTQGRSAPIRAEFELIEAAFDSVDTELDLKAPLASPALTGSPTAPTQAVTDDSTKLATTAFVHDVVGASGSLLPVQTGNAGKYLTTDGTIASWEPLAVSFAERSVYQDNSAWTAIPGQIISVNFENSFNASYKNFYCNGNFIAIPAGATTTCLTSPDGITWTSRTIGASGTYDMAAVVGNRILIGDAGTTVGYYSDDGGVTWTAATLPTASSAVLVGGPLFICSASSGTSYYTSATGATGSWTARNIIFTQTISQGGTWPQKVRFATGNQIWFGEGNSNETTRSADGGATWTADTYTTGYYATATDGTYARTITSTDASAMISSNYGDTWSAANFAANNYMRSICYGGRFVAVGSNNSTGYLTTNYATGNGAWTSVAIGTTAGVFYDVAYDSANTKYMAVGGTGAAKQAYTSTDDGASWTACATVPAGATALGFVTYDATNSKWVAAALTGSGVWWSSDAGANWTAGTAPGAFLWLGYEGGALLGLVAGVLYQSTDGGSTWSIVTSAPTSMTSIVYAPTPACYYAIAGSNLYRGSSLSVWAAVPYGVGALFKACGTAIMWFPSSSQTGGFRSTDGIAWSMFSFPSAYDSTTLRHDLSANTFSYLDGSTWRKTANGGSSWTSSTAYTSTDGNYAIEFGGVYLAGKDAISGGSGLVQVSHNGTDWITYDSGGMASVSYFPATQSTVWATNGTDTVVAYGTTFKSTATAVYFQ